MRKRHFNFGGKFEFRFSYLITTVKKQTFQILGALLALQGAERLKFETVSLFENSVSWKMWPVPSNHSGLSNVLCHCILWLQFFIERPCHLPYMRYYKPQLVYFLPHFQRPFLCFKGGFFRKFCPYVWLVFKSRLWWRA